MFACDQWRAGILKGEARNDNEAVPASDAAHRSGPGRAARLDLAKAIIGGHGRKAEDGPAWPTAAVFGPAAGLLLLAVTTLL
jgi:hypothetical protein